MKTSDLSNAKVVFSAVNPYFFSLVYQLWKFDMDQLAAVLTAICAKLKIGYAEITLITQFLSQNQLDLSGMVERYADQSNT